MGFSGIYFTNSVIFIYISEIRSFQKYLLGWGVTLKLKKNSGQAGKKWEIGDSPKTPKTFSLHVLLNFLITIVDLPTIELYDEYEINFIYPVFVRNEF